MGVFQPLRTPPFQGSVGGRRAENSRVSRERENLDTTRVELKETTVSGWDSYSNVFIGYPIW